MFLVCVRPDPISSPRSRLLPSSFLSSYHTICVFVSYVYNIAVALYCTIHFPLRSFPLAGGTICNSNLSNAESPSLSSSFSLSLSIFWRALAHSLSHFCMCLSAYGWECVRMCTKWMTVYTHIPITLSTEHSLCHFQYELRKNKI